MPRGQQLPSIAESPEWLAGLLPFSARNKCMAGAFFSRSKRVPGKQGGTNAVSVARRRFVCKRSVFQIEPVFRSEAGYELQVNSKPLKIRALRQ
jgi:hypothetical protein